MQFLPSKCKIYESRYQNLLKSLKNVLKNSSIAVKQGYHRRLAFRLRKF